MKFKVKGDYIVVGDIEGYLHWIRASDGVIAGRDRVAKEAIRGTPQVTPTGTLLALTIDGKLAAYPAPAQ